jgi:starch synthase
MNILHTSAEYFPYIKVGGLSDMLASLSKYQSHIHEVHIAIPLLNSFKSMINFSGKEYPALLEEDFYTTDACLTLSKSKFLHSKIENINLYFFHSDLFLQNEKIYGNTNELYSFALFSYACYTLGIILNIDIIHAHDWHTSLACVINGIKPNGKPSVFTIHNLAYQGDHPFWMTGFLKVDPFNIQLEDLANYEKVNYMKGALLYAKEIATVSPGYRDEVLHEPAGCHLSWLLKERHDSFTGILNGIDEKEWSPIYDKNIYINYSKEDVDTGKLRNKEELYKQYGLKIDPSRPLIGSVGRLTYQKGYETFLSSFKQVTNLPFYYFILGSGDTNIEGTFFHESHHSSNRLFFYKGFDEILARKIEAASDFFLMPSLFEPCGLNQLYSHGYGSIPIVSRIGGLKDSVQESAEIQYLTGFLFEPGLDHSLNYALARAFDLYSRKEDLSVVRKKIMNLDWSWKRREIEYERLYKKALSKK